MVVYRKMYGVHYGRVCGCALWEGVWMCIIGGYVAQCMCEDEGVKLCGCERGRTEESW